MRLARYGVVPHVVIQSSHLRARRLRGIPEGQATLLETGPGVTVEQVVAATEATLVLPSKIPQMQV